MHSFDIQNYHDVFHYAPISLWLSNDDSVYGCWKIGNYYSRAGNSKFHGAYPRTYLERVFALFPNRNRILHLFSGQLDPESPNETTFDINPLNFPDVVGESEEVHKHFQKKFDLVLADPPYTKEDAEIYGYKMPNKPKVMRSLAKIVKPGGVLVWLDIFLPMYRKEEWISIGFITLVISTNHKIRTVCLFQRNF